MRTLLLGLVFLSLAAAEENKAKSGRELAAAAAEAFEHGRSEDAVVLLRRALKLEPENSVWEAALGQILLSTARSAEAVPLLRHSLSASPADLEIRMALAQAYQNVEQDQDALRTL